MKYLICLAALLVTAAAVTAGPVRDRLAAWRENRPGVLFPKRSGCGSCAPAPSAARAGESCPGGVCPLPEASAPARVTRYTTVCEGGKCVLVPVRE